MNNSIEVGTRVEVFWSDDETYYAGKVTEKRCGIQDAKQKPKRKKKIGGQELQNYSYLVEYDDGEKDWIDASISTIRIVDEKSDEIRQQKSRDRAARLKIDSKLQIWWPINKAYFSGVLDRIDDGDENPKPHHIQYDDGDDEWTNLCHRFWMLKSEYQLKANTKVEVWWPLEKKIRLGTLTKIVDGKSLPHHVQYDDGGSQWTNLYQKRFEVLGKSKEVSSTISQVEAPSDDQLVANTRVMVWCPSNKKYILGTLTSIDGKWDLPHHIEYDDGSSEWTYLYYRRFEIVEKSKERSSAINQVQALSDDHLKLNTRVMVWWPLEKKSYPGTLTKIDSKRDLPHYIEYDDGDCMWTDLYKGRFEIEGEAKEPLPTISQTKPLSPNQLIENLEKAKKLSKAAIELKVNSRVMVWWPLDKKDFLGKLTKIDPKRKLPHHIQYDDGDTEWTDLNNRKFEIVGEAKKTSNSAEKLKVGTAVMVWWPLDKKDFPGTITKIDAKRDLPHHIEYDDGDAEWTNLNNRRFEIVRKTEKFLPKRSRKTTNETPTKVRRKVLVRNLKRRKRISRNAKLYQPSSNENEDYDGMKQRSENGQISMGQSPTKSSSRKRRRLTSPMGNGTASDKTDSHNISTSLRCKQCGRTGRGLRALSCHHVLCQPCRAALKRRECPICEEAIEKKLRRYDAEHDSFKAIEALDMITTTVEFEFFCASDASLGTKILIPSQIVKACRSRKRDEQEYEEYFWRFKGDKRILAPSLTPSRGIPIEQVSLESGEIIEAFTSVQKAVEKTGVSRKIIKRVLDGKGKANGGGFFWRLKDNTNGPWAEPTPIIKEPVANIPCVQLRRAKNGEVLKQFRTPRDAQEYINSDGNFKEHYSWSQICQWCREESYELGFYWKYERSGEDLSPSNFLVGKRIRLFQDGNDKGQESALPVEQVDVQTGEILASFDSAIEAAFAVGEESESCILDVCAGQQRSCYGYFWRFKGSRTKPTKLDVQQLCFETGKVIATFETIPAASRAIGVSTQAISNCCDGRNRSKSAGGFGWRFAIDDEEIVMID